MQTKLISPRTEHAGPQQNRPVRRMATTPPQLGRMPDLHYADSAIAPAIAPAVTPVASQNHTGLPTPLKQGIEALSGISLDPVRVHYNSPQPRQYQALAFARGNEIHVAPGQQQHLAHEAWHVVQQAQGRVRADRHTAGGEGVNLDRALEHEADVMGRLALHHNDGAVSPGLAVPDYTSRWGSVMQCMGVPGTHANLAAGDFVDPGLIPPIGNIAPPILAHTTVPTTIFENGVAPNTVVEGATARAFPLSARTRAGGSGTNSAVRVVSRAATRIFGVNFRAGHLLNHHLGGSGHDHDNITAITASANALHDHGIERELQQDVSNGFIALYFVDCSNRAGLRQNMVGEGIQGLADTMDASYGLLRAGGDVSNPADYVPEVDLHLDLLP